MSSLSPSSLYDEPGLGDVLGALRRAWLYLMVGAALGFAAAFLFFSIVIPQYRATMMVAPTTRSGTPDISALFPGNASFAMEYIAQSFGPGDSSDFMRFESVLREAVVAGRLLNDPTIRGGVRQAHRFRIMQRPAPEDAAGMAQWLQENVKIEPVGSTRLRRISVLHPDLQFGVILLRALYDVTDEMIRAELVEKTDRRIAYLERELAQISHPEHRRIMTDLLMDQEQIAMILAVGEPYAAQLSEPPYAGTKPYWPRRGVVFPAFAMVGLVLGFAFFGLVRGRGQ